MKHAKSTILAIETEYDDGGDFPSPESANGASLSQRHPLFSRPEHIYND